MSHLLPRGVAAALALAAAWAGTTAAAAYAGPADNRLFPVAGVRQDSNTPDPRNGRPATQAGVDAGDVIAQADGGFLVSGLHSVWRVDPGGRLAHVVGRYGGTEQDEVPARDARLTGVADIALAADGGLLIADGCRVRLRRPTGIVSTVAGSRELCSGSEPASGDGGPATAARLGSASGVAPLPDGGFLIADSSHSRVRRVGSDGTISTVAGNGIGRSATHGVPATASALNGPSKVAAGPDGSFVLVDYNGAHRVAPDGTINAAAAAGRGSYGLTEGGILYRTGGRHTSLQLFGTGPLAVSLGYGRPGYFGGDGDVARKLAVGVGVVEPTADGGLLTVADRRVLFAAPPDTKRLAVAITRESLRSLLRRRLRFRSTRPARVEIRVSRGQKLFFRASKAVSGGATETALPRRLRTGVYTVRLVARSPEGSVASDRLPMLIGPTLPEDLAGQALDFAADGELTVHRPEAADMGDGRTGVSYCKRFGPRRVDCAMELFIEDEIADDCEYVGTAILRRNGHLFINRYACPKRGEPFRSRPRLRSRWSEAPSLREMRGQ